MEALLSSTLAVAIAEIGDKTQLLSLFLVTRFSRPHERWAIIAGIVVATLVNHALSAWLGASIAAHLPEEWLPRIVAISFFAIAIWLLVPDSDGDGNSGMLRYGAFLATSVLFFVAEIGDKTQIATVVLAARYEAATAVVIGTTLGMLAANVPVVLAGSWIMDRMPLAWARWLAFALFLALGVVTLLAG